MITSNHPPEAFVRQRNTPVKILEAQYGADQPLIRAIRFEVFVDEQAVPPEIEMDDRDPLCIHLLAYVGNEAVGTARIDIEHGGKIGRLAVLANFRQQGIGRALMERCHDIAKNGGLASVWCNAQITAVPFYESLGYSATGEPFDEAGISHLKMTKALE